jgi:hypothetical protein
MSRSGSPHLRRTALTLLGLSALARYREHRWNRKGLGNEPWSSLGGHRRRRRRIDHLTSARQWYLGWGEWYLGWDEWYLGWDDWYLGWDDWYLGYA